MNSLYMHMTYEDYKNLEKQLANFKQLETSHKTVEGGYHKAFRLKVTDSLIIEFQGPLLKGFGGYQEPSPQERQLPKPYQSVKWFPK